MNNKILIAALLLSVTAVAAVLLSVRSLTAESFIGYAAVLALLGVAALEYRVNWKRLFGRS